MNKRLKIFLGATTLLLSVKTSQVALNQYRTSKAIKNQEVVEEYFKSHKSEIEKETEQRFHIRLDGVKLNFEELLRNPNAIMVYTLRTDTITVAKYRTSAFLEKAKGIDKFIQKRRSTKGNYIHELGHDYTLQRMGKLNIDPSFTQRENTSEEQIRFRTITEGIAEYFAIESGALKQYTFSNTDSLEEAFKNHGIYEVGRQIVTPILNKLGVKDGIDAIVTSPLITKKEIYNPQLFQKRIFTFYAQRGALTSSHSQQTLAQHP